MKRTGARLSQPTSCSRVVHATHEHAHVKFLKSNTTSKTPAKDGGVLQLPHKEVWVSHPLGIHALQDTAAAKPSDMSSAGAGATALSRTANCSSPSSLRTRVFHHHLCICWRLACTPPAWRFEEGAGWVEQKLLNGMGTIMNGTSLDKKKCIQNVFNHVTLKLLYSVMAIYTSPSA